MSSPVSPHHDQPPMREGVTASQAFLPELSPRPHNLFDYLCEHFPHIQPSEWQQRFQDQLVLDLQGNPLQMDSPYIAHTHIYYYRFLSHEIHVPFYEKIIFENNDLLVADKPHFLTMSPTGQYLQETLLVRLKKTTQNPWLTPIHRLDRETAGVVLFSKRPETRGLYQQLFAERAVQKIYHAIAAYRADLVLPATVNLRMEKGQPFYTMQVTEGAHNSSTAIELLEQDGRWAKYRLKPTTGKQHQLRVHLSHLNIPIKNDPFYPEVIHKNKDDFSAPLQLLANQISFRDPLTAEEVCFCSEQVLTL
ncbi:pseudouridine synthase [Acinetobacter sp. WZC-1]|uniref:pseudouridine synthase n=1 Tax=Acinetobacter sp. WZC-1 TaxID=3459034 RepID=UPI00403D9D52